LEIVFGLPVLAVLAWFFHRLFHGVWLDESPEDAGPALPPEVVGGAVVEGGEAWRIQAGPPEPASQEGAVDPAGAATPDRGMGPSA
jgi:hypothetical protein